MTDNIIKMARESGLDVYEILEEIDGSFDALERFVELVRRDEREACAEVADKYAKANEESDNMSDAFIHCAAAIRARGSKE